jgi:hypothetical protein
MTTEYTLNKNSTTLELRMVLEHLAEDAKDLLVPLALYNTQWPDAEKRAEATYLMGQIDLIRQLLWALGECEDDGITDPTVSVKQI